MNGIEMREGKGREGMGRDGKEGHPQYFIAPPMQFQFSRNMPGALCPYRNLEHNTI